MSNRVRVGIAAVFAAFTVGIMLPSQVDAATFTVNFCTVNPGECTEDNIDSATLTFEEIVNADPNDYTVTAVITGGPNGTTLDEVQVAVDGHTFEEAVTVSSVNGGANPGYVVFYDNINGGSACSDVTIDGKDFCASIAEGTGVTAGDGFTNTFVFSVNLVDPNALAAGSPVNLRLNFSGNGGIFSPGGGTLTTGSGSGAGAGSGQAIVPEPASLLLLGTALVGVAARMRKRRTA